MQTDATAVREGADSPLSAANRKGGMQFTQCRFASHTNFSP